MSSPRRRPLRILLFAIVAAVALTADIVTKVLVVAKWEDRASVRLLFGAVWISVTRNSGAAFSLGTGFTLVLTVIALAVVIVILRAARRLRSIGWAVALGLVLGGALGNLVDRVVRAPGPGRGHVVDWISVFGPDGAHYPIFNLADSAIVCGGILAVVLALRGIEFDGTRGAGRRSRRDRPTPDGTAQNETAGQDETAAQDETAGQDETAAQDETAGQESGDRSSEHG